MSAKKGHGTEHWATWRRSRRREWSDARSEDRDGMGGEGIGRDARTGDGWGEDGENWGEGREEKERGCAPRVEDEERATGIENAYWGGTERVGKEPERLREEGEGRRVQKWGVGREIVCLWRTNLDLFLIWECLFFVFFFDLRVLIKE